MAKDVKPVLGALNPTAQGLDAGLQQGAGNVKAAVQNAGVAVNQIANGLADVGDNAVLGLGSTAGRAPAAILELANALQHGGGPIGSLLAAVLGGSS